MPSKQKTFRSAAMLMILTIITGVIIMLMAVSLALFSISINQRRIVQNASNTAFATVDGCAEEGLERLRHNFSYAGETFSLNNLTCTTVVGGTSINRTLSVTASNSDFARSIQMAIITYPTFTVSSWQETST